jgi:hypothetical protein
MLVTEGTPDAWGGDLSRWADLVTEEDASTIAVRPAETGDQMKLTLDPECVTTSKHVRLNADELDELADLCRARANELRGGVR